MPDFSTLIPFYFVSFLLGIFLPAIIVSLLVWRFSKPSDRVKFSSLLPIILTLIAFAIVTNILWERLIFNHIYYEWDRVFLPYTFIGHEEPVIDISNSWLAAGWTKTDLGLLWLGISFAIYIFSGLIAFYLAKLGKIEHELKKIIVRLVLILFLISLIVFLLHWTPLGGTLLLEL